MSDLKKEIVIVTGGTRGIGAGITEAFLKQGAKVIATYAGNDQAALAFKEKNSQFGDQLLIKKFNVAKMNECEKFFEELDAMNLSPSVLVNNSGIRKDNIIPLMNAQDFQDVIDINLNGTFHMSKLAINRMMRARYGRIINMSSIGGMIGLPGQSNYAASKAGQIALSKVLSKEVGKRNITVNNIAPGFIETELLQDLPPELIEEYKKQVPLKRFGKVEEVAHAVLFLASREASYITGTTIEVTGGLG